LKREQKLTAQGERNHALDGERKAAEHAASATRHTEQSACDQRTHKICKKAMRTRDKSTTRGKITQLRVVMNTLRAMEMPQDNPAGTAPDP
jgi:hypothetical protein